jgi:hypothetical protein
MNKTIKKIAEGENKKVVLKDVVNGLSSLNVLVEQKLPVFSSFKLSLFLKNVSPIIESYNKERDKLVVEYGTPTKGEDGKENGNYTFPDAEKAKEFTEKINSLLEVEIEIGIPEIKVADLGSISIEPKYLTPLTWLLKE